MSGSRFVERAQTPGTSDEPLPVIVTEQTSSTSALTNVPANVASVTILAANAARLGATVYNDTTLGNLFLKLNSAAASAMSFTVRMVPQSYYEVPFDYVGAITGIWDVADGDARVTEFTP